MCVWDETSGRITLSDTVSLCANAARKRVLEALEHLTGTPCMTDDPQRASMVSSGVFPFYDTFAGCVCSFSQGRLRTVEIMQTNGTAAQQRAAFFNYIGRKDPCPDDLRSVRIRYAFGMVWIAADPRTGGASLRITYTAKE